MTHVWTWLLESVVLAIHDAQISEHGGPPGVRGRGLLQSALARPRNLAAYENPDAAALAASYAWGLARNHPFMDGNKRIALIAMELFLNLNGWQLSADDAACVDAMMAIADGSIDEPELAAWLRENISAAPSFDTRAPRAARDEEGY